MNAVVDAWLRGEARARLLAADAAADPVHAGRLLLADAEWCAAILAPLIAVPAADWSFPARRAGSWSTLLLHRGKTLSLAATIVAADAPPDDTIVANGRLSIARCVAGRGRVERRWTGPAGTAFVAAEAPALGAAQIETVEPGRVVTLDGRVTAWRMAADADDMILLTMTFAPAPAAIVRQFDGNTGALVRVTAVEGASARAAMLTAALDALPIATACAGYVAASRNAAFFVRWQAMRAWLTRDPDAALPRAAAMSTHDPHPEIRAAARIVVGNVQPCPA